MSGFLRGYVRSVVGIGMMGWGAMISAVSAEGPAFTAITLDENIGRVCYAVTVADMDGDGDQDVVALSESRVVWYDQPQWRPHVIVQDQTPLDNVCMAAHDIDGDGQIDLAIGAGWTKAGSLHWARRSASGDGLWSVLPIGHELNVHRMRWADVLGTGRPQLVVSPLNASRGEGVRLLAFEIPSRPDQEPWPSTVLNDRLNRMHNHWHVDLDGQGAIDTLTASREGLSLVTGAGDAWSSALLSHGVAGAGDPNMNGVGEVRVGQLRSGRRFIATVEPMHGDHLAVYMEKREADKQPIEGRWERVIIDRGFQRGHALGIADFDGDGSEDIAMGHSDTPGAFGVRLYCYREEGKGRWQASIVDEGGMATEDLAVADLTGDGLPDIVAGGRSTQNVKLYVHQGYKTPAP